MVYRKGDPKDEIYFINKGEIIYLNEQGHELLVLESGDIFGEIELINDLKKRKYFAASKTDVVLYVCKSHNFENLLSQHELV